MRSMDKYGIIKLLTLSTVIVSMSFTDVEEHSNSACFEQPEKTLMANCSLGEMVKMNDIFFGHNSGGECHWIENSSCITREPDIPTCVGHSTCSVNLPSGSLGRKIQQCDQYTNYMQILYNCVPSQKVIDICSNKEITEQSGYIKSSNYPKNYPATHQCNITIKAHTDQLIRLYAIDLDIASVPGNGITGGNCTDLLYIKEPWKSFTVCGKRNNDLLVTTATNSVTLTFQSNKEGLNKGFWLKFEAFPQKLTTPSPEAVLDTTTALSDGNKIPIHEKELSLADLHNRAGGSSNDYPGKTGKTKTDSSVNDQSADIPLGGIVGGILGTLFFILLVLLILLIIKRRKDRESMTTSHSTAQLHVGTSSLNGVARPRSFQGNTGPYIQNNLTRREEQHDLQEAVGGCDSAYEDDNCKSAHFGDICKQV